MRVHTLFIRLHASSANMAVPPGQKAATSAAHEAAAPPG